MGLHSSRHNKSSNTSQQLYARDAFGKPTTLYNNYQNFEFVDLSKDDGRSTLETLKLNNPFTGHIRDVAAAPQRRASLNVNPFDRKYLLRESAPDPYLDALDNTTEAELNGLAFNLASRFAGPENYESAPYEPPLPNFYGPKESVHSSRDSRPQSPTFLRELAQGMVKMASSRESQYDRGEMDNRMLELLKQSSAAERKPMAQNLQVAYEQIPDVVKFETERSKEFGLLRFSEETPETLRFGGMDFYLVELKPTRR